MWVLVFFIGAVTAPVLGDLSHTYADPRTFFGHCLEQNSTCTDYQCYTKIHALDLRKMDRLACQSNTDCVQDQTKMVCVQYQGGKGFCECPRHFAYNVTSCQCQKAAVCLYGDTPQPSSPHAPYDHNSCHSGMQCFNERCSCTNLEDSLFEAQSRLCVRPRHRNNHLQNDDDDVLVTSGGTHTGLVVLLIILICVLLVAIAIGIYLVTEKFTCKKGDYECEDQKGSSPHSTGGETHVAAWDLPSLDYLSEEQTMKYLKRHHRDSNGDIEVEESRSPSQGSSSLPESERQPINTHHINRAYVSEDDLQHV